MPQRPATRFALATNFLIVAIAGAPPVAQPRVSVRFHHVHYFVPDPAAAMSDAVRDLGARRVILPGVGIGVAVGEHYLLFERAQTETPVVLAGVRDIVDRSLRWLETRGLAAAGSPDFSKLPETLQSRWVKHVAFAADDLAAVAAHLRSQGVQPFQQSDDSVVYQSGDAGAVEFVRDSDRADAFWCPMHPDVRSPFASTCPLCAMALVPMPPPKLGDYRMDVAQVRGPAAKGLRFTIRDPETAAVVDRFLEVHQRLFHLFIVSRDLSYFAHEHPELESGRFDLAIDLPPGAYMLIADFLPAGGTPQMVQHAIVVGQPPAPFAAPPELKTDPVEKTVDGVHVRLTANLAAGREGTLSFRFFDAGTGVPIGDLEPYLGAPGHLLVVNRELTDAYHVHPGTATTRGPEVTFSPLLPSAGLYKLWVQVQRRAKVITVPFVINVR